jgi:hypothetical protein
MAHPDPVALAMRLSRGAFVSQFPDLFLVGDTIRAPAQRPAVTTILPAISWDQTVVSERPDLTSGLICPIRKVHAIFPRMITVGRTPNSDIVIPDDSVSKLHAYFKSLEAPGRFGLADANSTNGTFLDNVQLSPNVAPTPVQPGARLRFGRVSLTVVDGGTLWDRIRESAGTT